MTQRLKPTSNILNLDLFGNERNAAARKDRHYSPSKQKAGSKFKEKTGTGPTGSAGYPGTIKSPPIVPERLPCQATKARTNTIKQKSIPSSIPSISDNIVQYSASEDSATVEVTVKTSNGMNNGKRRSKELMYNKEPWGQLLKQHKKAKDISVFGKFDPLRTLHFLVKELQIQIKSVVPEDSGIIQMVQDMQLALKRVPPEVASTIHLQQAIDMLPTSKKFPRSQSVGAEKPSKLINGFCVTVDKIVQTVATPEKEELAELQKLMDKGTAQLETTCQQFENLCTKLKKEKKLLEEQLTMEREATDILRKRIEDVERENDHLLNDRIMKLEQEKKSLEETVAKQIERTDEYQNYKMEIKTLLDELKRSKSSMEEEMMKLKHQLRLNAIEKEKYVTILAVRDRQINEIRGEMAQLQEVVNDQLTELHNTAAAAIPSNVAISEEPQENNKAPIGDGTISSIRSTDDGIENKAADSFQELHSGDSDVLSILQSLPDNGFVDRMNRFFSKTAEHKVKMPTILPSTEINKAN